MQTARAAPHVRGARLFALEPAVTECRACPASARRCAGNVIISPGLLAAPRWAAPRPIRDERAVRERRLAVPHRSRVQSALWCKAAATTAAQCKNGHTGPLCGECLPGWSMDEVEGFCKDCTGAGSSSTTMLVGVVALVVSAAALAYLARRHIATFFSAYFPFLNRIQGAMRKYRVKAKIVVTFFQIISQYAGGIIAIPWPPVYERIAGSFDVLNFNVASLATASWPSRRATTTSCSS